MKKYLVTGGCGFIGSHLVEELSNNSEVVVLDNLSTGKKENIPSNIKLIQRDIEDNIDDIISEVDGCFHLAAIASVEKSNEEWLNTHRTNISGTINIFETIKKQNKKIPVIFASSAAIYGSNNNLPLKETEDAKPLSAYGADKYACELHGKIAYEVHKIPNIGFRFFNIYGPRQDPKSPYSGVISIFADKIKANQDITINGDGEQYRDFVFVKDVVKILVEAMNSNITHDVFNICTNRKTSILDLSNILKEITGNNVKTHYKEERVGDIKESIGDCSKLAKKHTLPQTKIKDGLKLTIGT